MCHVLVFVCFRLVRVCKSKRIECQNQPFISAVISILSHSTVSSVAVHILHLEHLRIGICLRSGPIYRFNRSGQYEMTLSVSSSLDRLSRLRRSFRGVKDGDFSGLEVGRTQFTDFDIPHKLITTTHVVFRTGNKRTRQPGKNKVLPF